MTTAYDAPPTDVPACRALAVLLVDDSGATRQIIASMLRRRGHSVTIARAGDELLGACAAGHFDAILMDIEMPAMDGYAAAAAIRRMESGRGTRTPIIALTAHAMEEDRRKCMDAGMDAFLPKPIDVGQLIFALESGVFGDGCNSPAGFRNGEAPGLHPEPAVDLVAMMRRLGGDAELLHQFVEVFAEDAPQLLNSIGTAAAAGDAAALRRAAHALRGLAANFDAQRVVEIASRFERAGIDEPLERVGELRDTLAEEVGRVMEALPRQRTT